MLQALAIIIAYLLGSIPSAYIAGRLVKKTDIRTVGGGNMGALNATRELGTFPGLVVLVVDVGKGAAAVLIAKALGVSYAWIYAAGFISVIGHCWPLFLKFKGGKGAATSIGVFLALSPWPLLCVLPIGLAVIFFTANVTLGLAAGFILLPLFLWLFHQPFNLVWFEIVLALFLGLRYADTARRNIRFKGWRDFLIEKNYTPWQTRRKNSK